MKRIIISEEEKSRILGMHVEATKRHYGLVSEQESGSKPLPQPVVSELIDKLRENTKFQGHVTSDPVNYYANPRPSSPNSGIYQLDTYRIVPSVSNASFSVVPSGNVMVDTTRKTGSVTSSSQPQPTDRQPDSQGIPDELVTRFLVEFIRYHASKYPNFRTLINNLRTNGESILAKVTPKVKEVYQEVISSS
jgi:hypothetical protein